MGKRRVYQQGFYDIKSLIKKYPTSAYYMVYGERRGGKTYSAKKVLIDSVNNGHVFIYMRRLHIHITKPKAREFFKDVQDYAKEVLGSEIYYEPTLGFYIINSLGDRQIIGYAVSVQDAFINKGIPLTNLEYILFDEFMDYTYMKDELTLFQHAIGNYDDENNRNNIKVIMLGNTIKNVYTPYFELFNINPKDIKQGKTYYLECEEGVTCAIEYMATRLHDNSKVKRNRLIGFANESSKMMLYGEWEYIKCNTTSIENISWKNMRHLVPIYITANELVYEMSLYTDSLLPILFVRNVNTQYGKVNSNIRYNLSLDNTVVLYSEKRKEFVPRINKINSLVDVNTTKLYKTCIDCLDAGRVIFSDISTGSNFIQIIKEINKGGI